MTELEGLPVELERDAMNGKEMPKGLGFPEQILYLELRMLYDQYRKKIVSREVAAEEKKRMLEEYQCYKICEEASDEWVAVIRETEMARAAFRKERTLENADKLVEIIEGKKFRRTTL